MRFRFWGAACFVVLVSSVQAQWRADRPIRGVWLRPPSTLAALETRIQAFARAGFTDLYLETFYHGVSTGKQGVFNARFGFDYLAAAIPLAARYGIRTHAWVEAGYWQFGTTGAYNFTSNPEWRVASIATGQPGGDIAGQVFANLTHPGVQAKLRAYTAELAAYPGLWGVQTDYHRFPIDDNTSDAFPAPWTYDAWTQSTYQAATGVQILTQADRPSRPGWNAFLTWRRNGVSEAARQMYLGIRGVSPDVVFSGAVFPRPATNSAQLSKCQDWTAWCAGGYLDYAVPMCYSGTTANIATDLVQSKALAGSRKVVAGLALGTSHPSIADQLTACKGQAIEDFAFFEGNAIDAAAESSMRNWLNSQATRMRADLNADGSLDVADYQLFRSLYSGVSVPSTAQTQANLDGDADLDSADHQAMRLALAKFRLGEFGLLTQEDRTAFDLARNAAPAGGNTQAKHLYDIEQDGDVDDRDLGWLERMAWKDGFAFVPIAISNVAAWPSSAPIQIEWLRPDGSVATSWTETLGNQAMVAVPMPTGTSWRMRLKSRALLPKIVQVSTPNQDTRIGNVLLTSGDANADGIVDGGDINAILSQFGAEVGTASYSEAVDVNADGIIDGGDVNTVLSAFGSEGDLP